VLADAIVSVQQEDHCTRLPREEHTRPKVFQMLTTTTAIAIAVRATLRMINACKMQVILQAMIAGQGRVELIPG
jgi:hypothetical protein